MLKDILTPAGHEFEFVNNGREGLKLIQEQKWDVVLLDLAMPEFSGRAVINELVKNDNIKKQPLVLFTASSISNEEIDEMIKMGVRLCLRKPIEIANLLDIIFKKKYNQCNCAKYDPENIWNFSVSYINY